MRKLYIPDLIALAAIIIGLAWADQITISTYYPAPYGVYREFKTTSNTYLATDSGNVGIGTTSPGGKLDVNGTIYQRGAQLHADYVFEPSYQLESIGGAR